MIKKLRNLHISRDERQSAIFTCNLFLWLTKIIGVLLITQWLCLHTFITWQGIRTVILWIIGILVGLIILGALNAGTN